DPRLEPTSRPAQIPREMIRFARTLMEKAKTSRTDAWVRGVLTFSIKVRAQRIISRGIRSEEHTSELQSLRHLVCRLLLDKKNQFRLLPQQLHTVNSHSVPRDELRKPYTVRYEAANAMSHNDFLTARPQIAAHHHPIHSLT